MIEGKLKHGTQHGSGGILNGLNTMADLSFMEDRATDNGLSSTKSFFLLLFMKCEAKNTLFYCPEYL